MHKTNLFFACAMTLTSVCLAQEGIDFGSCVLVPRDSHYSALAGCYFDLIGPTSEPLTIRAGFDVAYGRQSCSNGNASAHATDDSDKADERWIFDFRGSIMWFPLKKYREHGGFHLGAGPTVTCYDQTATDENAATTRSGFGVGAGLHSFIGYEAGNWQIEALYEYVVNDKVDLGGLWLRGGW